MSCQIRTLDNGETCLLDTQTDTMFGPLMKDMDEAESFMLYLDDHTTFKSDYAGGLLHSSDPRDYPPYLLRHHYDEFMRLRNEAKTEEIEETAVSDSIDDTARKLLREFAKNGVAEMSEVTSK